MPCDLNGARKSAILLLSLEQQQATHILRLLPPQAVAEVSREIASIQEINLATRHEVFSEFYEQVHTTTCGSESDVARAERRLTNSFSAEAAQRAVDQIPPQVQTTPFSFLQTIDAENLLTFIFDEHPQTIALILAHLPAQRASEIMRGLPNHKQIEVLKRIANMEQTNLEAIKEVERGLEQRLSRIFSQTFERAGGVDTVAEILNLADPAREKEIMEGFEAEDPDLAEQIRRLMFVFEDILLVHDDDMRAVLKEMNNEGLALALKTASEDLKQKILRSLSRRDAQGIADEMEFMGPVRVNDVEQAQQKMVDIVRRLEDAGEIVIAGRAQKNKMAAHESESVTSGRRNNRSHS